MSLPTCPRTDVLSGLMLNVFLHEWAGVRMSLAGAGNGLSVMSASYSADRRALLGILNVTSVLPRGIDRMRVTGSYA